MEILRIEESRGWLEEMGAEVGVMSSVAPHPTDRLGKQMRPDLIDTEDGDRKATLGSQSRPISQSWNQSRKSPKRE